MSESLEASIRIVKRRFVVLYHEMPEEDERASHFDWMFESGHSLRTWAVEANHDVEDFLNHPKHSADFQCNATQLADHRLLYLEHEGPISNNRGTVFRRLTGDFEAIDERDQCFHCRLRSIEDSNLGQIEVLFKQINDKWSLMVRARGEAPAN